MTVLSFESVSLTETGARRLARLSCLSAWDLPVSVTSALERQTHTFMPGIYVGS